MNEIELTSEASSVFYFESEVAPSTFWKKGGETLFFVFSIIAMGSFLPYHFHKKKRFTIQSVVLQAQENRPVSLETPIEASESVKLNEEIPPCTDKDRENIQFILLQLGTKNPLQLGFIGKDLRRRGDAIKHLHPFTFLTVIFSDNELKKHVRTVINKMFVGDEFLKGIQENMQRELDKKNIEPHIENFAQKVQVSADAVRPLIQNREWKQLLEHLIAKDGGLEEQISPA